MENGNMGSESSKKLKCCRENICRKIKVPRAQFNEIWNFNRNLKIRKLFADILRNDANNSKLWGLRGAQACWSCRSWKFKMLQNEPLITFDCKTSDSIHPRTNLPKFGYPINQLPTSLPHRPARGSNRHPRGRRRACRSYADYSRGRRASLGRPRRASWSRLGPTFFIANTSKSPE